MSAALPIRGLNHVGRLTKHLEASRAFYRDVLGFREIARPKFDFPGAWLYNYGMQIHLIENSSIPDADGPIQTRESHLAFEVDDLATVERQLAAQAIEYRKNVVPERGTAQIFCRDPDGNHVEFAVYGPTPPYVDADR